MDKTYVLANLHLILEALNRGDELEGRLKLGTLIEEIEAGNFVPDRIH